MKILITNLKKKLVGGLNKKKLLFFFFLFFFIPSNIFASIIVDYETEEFIKKLNNLILSVNNYNNYISFKIILDEKPNAFVNQDNQLFISSGLIKKSPSYVSLLGVLAHEIGHLEKYHIIKRKKSLKSLKNFDALGTISIIAGSIVSNNPEIIQTLAVNKVGINNFYINFTKDQEREADYYAIETLNKLDLPSHSLVALLNIIENESNKRGFTEEFQKFSTHPIFKERYQIINKKKQNQSKKIDLKLENEFKFIKAKFTGYTSDNEDQIEKNNNNELHEYSKAILYSKKGDLKKSLLLINKLIENFDENFFLLETKADILFSYGYKDEAVKFYKKVFSKYPNNKYVQIRIFNNINEKNLSDEEKNKYFEKNLNLLFSFPNNKVLYLKYKKLSNILNKNKWSNFFNLYNIKNTMNRNLYLKKLNNIIQSSDDKKLNLLIKKHIDF